MNQLSRIVGVGLVAVVGSAGCGQQPYRVFAVQVAAAPTNAAVASAGIAAASSNAGAAAAAGTPARLRRVGLERGQSVLPRAAAEAAKHPQWDLNRASAATLLEALPGSDAATVGRIIAARPYKAKRELLRRKIVTAAQYARWKDRLVVHRAAASTGASLGG